MNEKHTEIITEAGVLRGMIHLPENKKPLGTVVIFHGYFSSNRVGPARLYIEMARVLSSCGFYVMRFDCLGVGDSDGKFSDVTLESEIRDFTRISHFALKYSNTPNLTIIGHSMGANLAIYVATHFKEIERLLFIAPDIDKLDGLDRFFNSKQLHDLETKGGTIRKGLFINASFINSIRSRSLLSPARNIDVPCFVFQGTNDELYSLEGAKSLANSLPKGHLILIEGGDHNFLSPKSRFLLFENIKNVMLELHGKK